MSNNLRSTSRIPFFLFIGVATSLAGCITASDIKSQALRDRVYACSAGFSDDVNASLQLVYDKAAMKEGVLADLKEESQAIIFSKLPQKDRLKVYEDYIGCIEQNWNSKNNLCIQNCSFSTTQNINKQSSP